MLRTEHRRSHSSWFATASETNDSVTNGLATLPPAKCVWPKSAATALLIAKGADSNEAPPTSGA